MKQHQNLCVLFWLRKSKTTSGPAPLYVRLTIEGLRSEFALGRKAYPDKWLAKAGIMKGTNEEARTINHYINQVKTELHKHYNHLLSQYDLVTPEMVRNSYLGITESKKTLVELFEFHILQLEEKAKIKVYSPKTVSRYKITLKKVTIFMKDQYKVSDMSLENLKISFLKNFEHYLRVKDGLQNNTAMKYIKILKKVVVVAQSHEWLTTNPFQTFKCSYIQPEREVLTQEDLDKLNKKHISIQRLAEVRDVFLFCCYTGFAYNEVESFAYDAIQRGLDGEKWLSINRAKTGTLESVMLLPLPLEIIGNYREHKYCKTFNKLLPVNSNQRYNAYLKELADICGITIKLTTHIARHTFATTVTLANDVPIETVSALLGHKDIRTTQIYAKVVKKKVSNDMKALRSRLLKNEEEQFQEAHKKYAD